jgi:hypothetical protein
MTTEKKGFIAVVVLLLLDAGVQMAQIKPKVSLPAGAYLLIGTFDSSGVYETQYARIGTGVVLTKEAAGMYVIRGAQQTVQPLQTAATCCTTIPVNIATQDNVPIQSDGTYMVNRFGTVSNIMGVWVGGVKMRATQDYMVMGSSIQPLPQGTKWTGQVDVLLSGY